MVSPSTKVVICGAGIAGIPAAYSLIEHGILDVVLVDEAPVDFDPTVLAVSTI